MLKIKIQKQTRTQTLSADPKGHMSIFSVLKGSSKHKQSLFRFFLGCIGETRVAYSSNAADRASSAAVRQSQPQVVGFVKYIALGLFNV
jgi:hypothetical protein